MAIAGTRHGWTHLGWEARAEDGPITVVVVRVRHTVCHRVDYQHIMKVGEYNESTFQRMYRVFVSQH